VSIEQRYPKQIATKTLCFVRKVLHE